MRPSLHPPPPRAPRSQPPLQAVGRPLLVKPSASGSATTPVDRSKEELAWPNWYMKEDLKGKKSKWKQHATAVSPYGGLVCEVTGSILRRKYRWRLLLQPAGSAVVPGASSAAVPSLDIIEALYRATGELGRRELPRSKEPEEEEEDSSSGVAAGGCLAGVVGC